MEKKLLAEVLKEEIEKQTFLKEEALNQWLEEFYTKYVEEVGAYWFNMRTMDVHDKGESLEFIGESNYKFTIVKPIRWKNDTELVDRLMIFLAKQGFLTIKFDNNGETVLSFKLRD